MLFPILSFSQSKEIDSLRKDILKTKIDTVKVNSLNLLAEKLLKYNLENAIDTLNLSIKIAKKNAFFYGLAKAYKVRGLVFYYQNKVDSSLASFETGKSIYEKNGFLSDAGRMANNIGIVKAKLGDLQGAIKSYMEAIELLKQAQQYLPLIAAYINASNSFRYIGDFQKALEFNFEALKSYKLIKDINNDDSLQIGHIYKSIANIYADQKSYKEALNYYHRAFKIYEKYKSLDDQGDIYLNIGYVYGSEFDTIAEKNNYILALSKYTMKDKIALACLNLADSYKKLEIFDSTKYYLDLSLQKYTELNDKRGLALVYNSYGEYYSKLDMDNNAILILNKGLEIAKEVGDIKIISSLSNSLYVSYEKVGDYKGALDMHVLYKEMEDSIFNTNNEKKLTQISLTYDFDKEKAQSELKYNEELKRQKIIKNFSFLVLFFLLMAFFGVFYAFRTKKRKNEELSKKNAEILMQNEEIEAQKEEIEIQLDQIAEQKDLLELQSKETESQRDLALERGNLLEIKNKDIEASIYYALRIQQAILPNVKIIDKYFKESFIYYKPRDIVSGDFYWASEKDNKLILVAADCTGHGVPGAFMSMLGVSFLNQIVSVYGILDSKQILSKLREMVISSLKQSLENENTTKDGMDLSLIIFDKEKLEIQFSGAYNSLYIVSDELPKIIQGDDCSREHIDEKTGLKLLELKADRMPIGIFVLKSGDFTKKLVQLKAKDRIYMFSDGFPDLFNRDFKQKFTSRRFKNMFLENYNINVSSQKQMLEDTFVSWVGNEKQIDDILVIGLEV